MSIWTEEHDDGEIRNKRNKRHKKSRGGCFFSVWSWHTFKWLRLIAHTVQRRTWSVGLIHFAGVGSGGNKQYQDHTHGWCWGKGVGEGWFATLLL